MRRKQNQEPVYLEPGHVLAISNAMAKLTKIYVDHDVRFDGSLILADVAVGDVFYHAPAESYVIEWKP